MVCRLFQLHHVNYNCIPHLKLLNTNKPVKTLKLLWSFINSFYAREELRMETTSEMALK